MSEAWSVDLRSRGLWTRLTLLRFHCSRPHLFLLFSLLLLLLLAHLRALDTQYEDARDVAVRESRSMSRSSSSVCGCRGAGSACGWEEAVVLREMRE